MILNLVITGVGGQGNVVASQMLGRAAVRKGIGVTIGETYGLSQRGGPVMSQVRFHDNKILGPIIPPNSADIILGLEPLEALRVMPEMAKPETVFLVNQRPIYPLNVIAGDMSYPDLNEISELIRRNSRALFWLNATEKAVELGGALFLNTIMLGALVSLPDFPINLDDLESVFKATFEGKKLSLNLRALRVGRELMRGHES